MSQITRRRAVSTLAGSLAVTRLHALPARPKLFVLLIAEQFRADYLGRFSPLFGPGGFRRLMEEGAYLPDCRMNASSFSSSGLATLASGAYPQVHGIVAENWFDAASGEMANAGQSSIQAGSLADEIALADSRNRVYAMAMDASGAALAMGGPKSGVRHTILALGRPAGSEPDWVAPFRQSHSPERFKGAKWQGMLSVAGASALRTLIDDPTRPEEFAALYSSSPFAQETQFDFLHAALSEEKLGQGQAFDFVAVALGSMARLGYEVGADSPLMREMVLHLDRQIESTLDALKKQVGAGNFGLAFAAAHGAPNSNARPVSGVSIAMAIDKALSSEYDVSAAKNRYVAKYVYPFLYLDHGQLRRFGVDPREARRRAGEAALRLAPGVAAYYTADGDCSLSGAWRRRFENSFHALHSGDLMLAYQPNAVEEYGSGHGLSYGSLYNYDIRTPLLFYGPQFRARTVEEPVETIDIAPTLARALGVAAPSSSAGRVLGAVFAVDKKGDQ